MVWATIIAVPLFFGGCAEMSSITQGGGGILAPNSSKPATPVPKCTANHGTAVVKMEKTAGKVVVSGNPYTEMTMTQTNDSAKQEICEQVISQTGCFTMLASEEGTSDIEQENQIAGRHTTSGMRTADYIVRCSVTMLANTGSGAVLGGLVSPGLGLGGVAAGAIISGLSLDKHEATATLKVIAPDRTMPVHVEGASKSISIGLGGALLSGVSVGGGYKSMTPEERGIAAAFADGAAKLVSEADAVLPSNAKPVVHPARHHKKSHKKAN